MRDDLSDEERATVAWPAIQGIVEPQAYEQLGGLITTRSWTYRLRLAAGEIDADDADGAIDDAIIYEVVLDLSSPRPRIAYLREVTWLRTAAMIAVNVETGDDATDVLDELDASDADRAPEPVPDDPFSGDPAMEEQPVDAEPVPSHEAGDVQPASPAGKRIGRWTAG